MPFSTAERMKNRAPETADAKFSGQRTTLSNKVLQQQRRRHAPISEILQHQLLDQGRTSRAVRKASNAPFWGTAKALEETQVDSASTNAGGPGLLCTTHMRHGRLAQAGSWVWPTSSTFWASFVRLVPATGDCSGRTDRATSSGSAGWRWKERGAEADDGS